VFGHTSWRRARSHNYVAAVYPWHSGHVGMRSRKRSGKVTRPRLIRLGLGLGVSLDVVSHRVCEACSSRRRLSSLAVTHVARQLFDGLFQAFTDSSRDGQC
jgi:hypothetical protein